MQRLGRECRVHSLVAEQPNGQDAQRIKIVRKAEGRLAHQLALRRNDAWRCVGGFVSSVDAKRTEEHASLDSSEAKRLFYLGEVPVARRQIYGFGSYVAMDDALSE